MRDVHDTLDQLPAYTAPEHTPAAREHGPVGPPGASASVTPAADARHLLAELTHLADAWEARGLRRAEAPAYWLALRRLFALHETALALGTPRDRLAVAEDYVLDAFELCDRATDPTREITARLDDAHEAIERRLAALARPTTPSPTE